MQPIFIKGTEFSPTITLDPAGMKFEISGESRPENAAKLYGPVLTWIEEYCQKGLEEKKTNNLSTQMRFEFDLQYFNSVSAKYILRILNQISIYYFKGYDIKILWYYDSSDEGMKESGEEFSKLTGIPFEFIKK